MKVFYHPFSIKIWSWLNDVKAFLLAQEYRILLPMQEMMGSIPGLGRSPEEENGNPLQYSSLENPMDRGGLVGYSPWDHRESDTT